MIGLLCLATSCVQACLRLKGENGIMRKKFQALQKDIEEQREQLSLQHEQQKELYTTIKGALFGVGSKLQTANQSQLASWVAGCCKICGVLQRHLHDSGQCFGPMYSCCP